jgi:transposase
MDSATTKGGIAKLVWQLSRRRLRLIVVEATGGYEEELVMALFEADVWDRRCIE